MYQIIKSTGSTVAFTEAVRYVRLAENGSYVEADEQTAQGMVFAGTPYNLAGRAVLDATLATVSITTLTTDEAQAAQKRVQCENEIVECKAYLTSTDYVIAKLSEALAGNDTDTVAALWEQYREELEARKNARVRINELEAEKAEAVEAEAVAKAAADAAQIAAADAEIAARKEAEAIAAAEAEALAAAEAEANELPDDENSNAKSSDTETSDTEDAETEETSEDETVSDESAPDAENVETETDAEVNTETTSDAETESDAE